VGRTFRARSRDDPRMSISLLAARAGSGLIVLLLIAAVIAR
jgi:hypothetical protein